MTPLILAPIVVPVVASAIAFAGGWRRWTATFTVLSALVVLISGVVLRFRVGADQHLVLGGLLRADALSVTMLIVIGVVGTLTTWASIGYVDAELAHGHTDRSGARLYGALTPGFLAAMVLAVSANNIGLIWVAIEATTVDHRLPRRAPSYPHRARGDLEVCRDLLGRHRDRLSWHRAAVLCGAARGRRQRGRAEPRRPECVCLAPRSRRHPAGRRAAPRRIRGESGSGPLPHLARRRTQPGAGTGVGIDERGTFAVAFSVILRIRPIIDAATGPGFLRAGLLIVGLATVLVAALLLTVTADLKRMLAYSSMENMGLIAVAAAAGTQLAIAALLLHVLAHGVGKTVLFLAGGQTPGRARLDGRSTTSPA